MKNLSFELLYARLSKLLDVQKCDVIAQLIFCYGGGFHFEKKIADTGTPLQNYQTNGFVRLFSSFEAYGTRYALVTTKPIENP